MEYLASTKLSPYILGIDVGIASVGAAVLGESSILGLHVRTFERGEVPKTGASRNKVRRKNSCSRRRLRRKKHRLRRLRALLCDRGLLGSTEPSELKCETSPWRLRCEGLDRILAPNEWAVVIYHISKHRGFQSTRKSESKKNADAAKMLAGVSEVRALLKASNSRTVGELVATHPQFAEQKHNKHGGYSHTLARKDLRDELTTLFARQRELGSLFADAPLEEAVSELLMQRRPALSGEDLMKMVGHCTFEPTEKRAARATYTFQRFSWLQKLNAMRISDNGIIRGLSEEERDIVRERPFDTTKLTYAQIRSLLSLPDSAKFKNVDYRKKKDPEGATAFEAAVYHALRKAYERAGLESLWKRDRYDVARLDALGRAITAFKEDAEVRSFLHEEDVEPEVIEAALEESASTFSHLSLKAMQTILPHLERGLRYDEAVVEAGYEHHSHRAPTGRKACLPRFSQDDFRNPVVSRSLNQARKLINAIVREYGPPAAVHIELARDLSRSFRERKEIVKNQSQYRDRKDDIVKGFREHFGRFPQGDELTRLRLYREQGGKSAYCQMPLDLNRLLEPGYVEIDHALPRSRSFNDAMINKVLVFVHENRDKGNQTPYEYLDGAGNSEQWNRFLEAVNANAQYSLTKRTTLLRRDFGRDAATEFRERHLNDTRYIGRALKAMIETHLAFAPREDGAQEGQRCVVVSGRLTKFLRHRWGLEKNRSEGDLHHALDAAVVAACTRSMIKRVSDHARREELSYWSAPVADPETGEIYDPVRLRQLEAHFPLPWPHFREELLARLSPTPAEGLAQINGFPDDLARAVEPIRVSRAPRRRGLGEAHDDTIRSTKLQDEGVSTTRWDLKDLSLKTLPQIVGYEDPRNKSLMDAIEARLRAHGGNGKRAFKEPLYRPTRDGGRGPIVRSVKVKQTLKSGLPVRGGIANNGSMLRVDIFTDGRRFYGVPVYLSDAVRGCLPIKAATAKLSEDDWTVMNDEHQFLFSLYANDWVRLIYNRDRGFVEGYFIGFDRGNASMSVACHDRSPSFGANGARAGMGIKTLAGIEKYHVDPLGRLYRAAPETRKPLRSP